MAVSMIGPKFYAWDRDGKPLAFGKVYTYKARTNAPQVTYQSEDAVVANTNPVILNGEGYGNIYLDGSYKVVVKDKDDNEIWTADPVTAQGGEEWVNCMTATYLSSTTFKISGNVTDSFEIGRRIRIDNNAATYGYSTILSAVFAATDTTVTISDAVVTTGVINACVSIVGRDSIATGEVANVNKARELEPTFNGQEATLLGHTLPGVGGGSLYAILNDPEDDNNGTKFKTPSGHSWNRKESDFSLIPTTWFGLYDGASKTVCSAAVQGIIDFVESNPQYNSDNGKTGWCATLQFPAGRFPISNIRIKKFNFIFEGVGAASYLVNEDSTGRMLHVEEATSSTLGGFIMRDLHVRNVVTRADGAGEIIFLNLPVRGGLFDVIFTSSALNVGSRNKLGGDMLKTVSPFEFLVENVTFWGCDVGWDIISGAQSDTFECQGVVFSSCTIGMIGFRGAGGSGNNNFKFSGKFLAQQGGNYVSSGADAYAKTTVVSTSANDLTVTDATNMQVGRAVVVGTDNTFEFAIIKSISVNTLSLDRPITKAASTRVLSGKIGMILVEMRNPAFEGVQIEGCDIGLLCLTGSRNITVDGYSLSSSAKGIYLASQFRRFSLLDGGAGSAGVMQNGVTFKVITLDTEIATDANKIYLNNVPGESSSYFDNTLPSLIDNLSGFSPFIQIDSRLTGDTHMGDNSSSAIEFTDKSYLTFNRTTTSKFTRTRWQTAAVDQWFLNHTGSSGDLGIRKNGESVDSLTFFQSNGDMRCGSGVWDDPLFRVGNVRFWAEGSNIRVKGSAPTSAVDGTVLGTF